MGIGKREEGRSQDRRTELAKQRFESSVVRSKTKAYRKTFLRWVDQAKRPETRAGRIAEMVKMLQEGKLKG